jgi:ACS family hexuronate transporter-like MFS transporter
VLVAKAVGYILQWTGSYVPVFLMAASAYLLAVLVIHLLAPGLSGARLAEA